MFNFFAVLKYSNNPLSITEIFCRSVSQEEAPIVRRQPDYRNDENPGEPKSKDSRKNKYGDVWT